MTGGPAVWLPLTAAGLLLLLDLAMSVALAAADTLSHVTLRRLASEGGDELAFLETMQQVDSAHRVATIVGRQLCLLGVTLGVVLAARGAGLPAPEAVGGAVGAVVVVIVVEMIAARAIALWAPRGSLHATAIVMRAVRSSLFFVVGPVRVVLGWVRKRQRITDEEREEEQDEEVEALIEVGERAGLLEGHEGAMMRGIVELDETTVREIMTPRTDIVALSETASVEEARRTIQQAGHSRIPVYRESIDTVTGLLHARDLFQAWEDGSENAPVSRYLRPPTFVPEFRTAADLLADMRQTSHLAIVVDEYGGTAGLVTLEDLLEEIVGEITDEYDPEERPIEAAEDGSFLIDAATHVEELESLFGIDLGEREYDTVGGFVVAGFGRVPAAGESMELNGLAVEVTRAERRRVTEVRLRPVAGGGRMETG